MRYLVAIDSFKECMSSEEAGSCLSQALGDSAFLPVSDGGEGFATCLAAVFEASRKECLVHGPMGDPVVATYYIKDDAAIIDTASASGLALVPRERRNPMIASTFGTGEIIADAIKNGARRFYIGLGGSATVDAGLGLLRALGFKIMTRQGAAINPVLANIIDIDSSAADKLLSQCSFHALCDVDVPLYGKGGAAQMFAPQKGAGPQLTEALDGWLERVAAVYQAYSGRAVGFAAGSGAAGGLGAGLSAVLHAQLKSGIKAYLDLIDFKKYLIDSEYFTIITGEGSADEQTLHGKVPFGILEYVKEHAPKAKVILVAGKVRNADVLLAAGFSSVYQITPDGTSLQEALRKDFAFERLRSTAQAILEEA